MAVEDVQLHPLQFNQWLENSISRHNLNSVDLNNDFLKA